MTWRTEREAMCPHPTSTHTSDHHWTGAAGSRCACGALGGEPVAAVLTPVRCAHTLSHKGDLLHCDKDHGHDGAHHAPQGVGLGGVNWTTGFRSEDSNHTDGATALDGRDVTETDRSAVNYLAQAAAGVTMMAENWPLDSGGTQIGEEEIFAATEPITVRKRKFRAALAHALGLPAAAKRDDLLAELALRGVVAAQAEQFRDQVADLLGRPRDAQDEVLLSDLAAQSEALSRPTELHDKLAKIIGIPRDVSDAALLHVVAGLARDIKAALKAVQS